MKILKSTGFFIKSFLAMAFLTVVTIFLTVEFLEPFAYNYMTKYFMTESANASNNTVIIMIDDKSISYHRWPWPREYYGKIINYLNEYSKTKVIGFDAIIPGLDKDNPKSDEKFFKAVSEAKNLVVGFQPMLDLTNDKGKIQNYLDKFFNKFYTVEIINNNPIPYPKYNAMIEYPDKYLSAANNMGSIAVPTNNYGYVTMMNQIISVNGDYYPSLALRMYMYENNLKSLLLTPYEIIIEETGLVIPVIPNRDGMQNYIRYYGKYNKSEKNSFSKFFKYIFSRYGNMEFDNEGMYTHQKYSASDILRSYDMIKQGKKPIVDPHEFDGKTVFIGANAKAHSLSLEDAIPTPLDASHPGPDIQATNYDNIRYNQFVRTTNLIELLTICAGAVILTLILITKLSLTKSITISILISVIYCIIAATCYTKGYALILVPPIALQLVSSIFGYSYKYIIEGRNKEKIKLAMGKYISQDIMKNVVKDIDNIKLGGKRATVTVLFADIRGFTSMSEKMLPEEVSNILNEYFTEIEPIITEHNGVINKFIGDAVMAIFGEPIQDLNHPVNAVKCAYAMLKKVQTLQEKWLFEGKPKIEIGVGINTGEAFVGNIGSEKRLEYTVIGDTVNLASRIEHYNKVYHTNLLVSSSTYKYITDIADVIKISEVTIRGKAKKMDIYEVLRLTEPKTDRPTH